MLRSTLLGMAAAITLMTAPVYANDTAPVVQEPATTAVTDDCTNRPEGVGTCFDLGRFGAEFAGKKLWFQDAYALKLDEAWQAGEDDFAAKASTAKAALDEAMKPLQEQFAAAEEVYYKTRSAGDEDYYKVIDEALATKDAADEAANDVYFAETKDEQAIRDAAIAAARKAYAEATAPANEKREAAYAASQAVFDAVRAPLDEARKAARKAADEAFNAIVDPLKAEGEKHLATYREAVAPAAEDRLKEFYALRDKLEAELTATPKAE